MTRFQYSSPMFMICIESGFNSYARTVLVASDNSTLSQIYIEVFI